MEAMVKKLSIKLARAVNGDEERRAVIEYGLGALVQMLSLLIIALLFGSFFFCLPESLIVYFGVGLMRRTTGGAHAQSYLGCMIVSTIVIFLLSLAARYCVPVSTNIWPYFAFAVLPSFGVFGIYAWKRVPIDTVNKPINRPEKIRRLRIQCGVTFAIYLVAACTMIALSARNSRLICCAVSLCFAVLWQAFTLTGTARKLIGLIDQSVSL